MELVIAIKDSSEHGGYVVGTVSSTVTNVTTDKDIPWHALLDAKDFQRFNPAKDFYLPSSVRKLQHLRKGQQVYCLYDNNFEPSKKNFGTKPIWTSVYYPAVVEHFDQNEITFHFKETSSISISLQRVRIDHIFIPLVVIMTPFHFSTTSTPEYYCPTIVLQYQTKQMPVCMPKDPATWDDSVLNKALKFACSMEEITLPKESICLKHDSKKIKKIKDLCKSNAQILLIDIVIQWSISLRVCLTSNVIQTVQTHFFNKGSDLLLDLARRLKCLPSTITLLVQPSTKIDPSKRVWENKLRDQQFVTCICNRKKIKSNMSVQLRPFWSLEPFITVSIYSTAKIIDLKFMSGIIFDQNPSETHLMLQLDNGQSLLTEDFLSLHECNVFDGASLLIA